MASFELDDVRESFTTDVTRFLTDIDRGAAAVAASVAALPADDDVWHASIGAMTVGLHGIVGSSSLIGLDSLTAPARRLEGLAVSASESLRHLRFHASRLARIAATCLDGGLALRAILDSELEDRRPLATTRAADLAVRLDTAVASLAELTPPAPGFERPPQAVATAALRVPPMAIPAIPLRQASRVPTLAPPLTAESAVDAEWDEPAAEIDPELADVFRDEAREAFVSLRTFEARLVLDSHDQEAQSEVARLFHLLKGAAAAVGFRSFSARASELNALVERERARGLGGATLATIRSGIDALVALAGTDPVPAAPGQDGEPVGSAAEDDAFDRETQELFQEEARAAIEDLRVLLEQVRISSGAQRGSAATRLERIFHRLKGSALIVGQAAIAELAERGQAACEESERADPNTLKRVIEQIVATMTGAAADAEPPDELAAAPAGPLAIRVALPPAEEWDAYLSESTEIMDELDRVLATLEGSARPTAGLDAVFRSYHTLKGASMSVGLHPVGKHLHVLESFVERLRAQPTIPDLRAVVKALADAHAAIRRSIVRLPKDGSIIDDSARLAEYLGGLGMASPATSWIAASDSVWSTGARSNAPSAQVPADSQAARPSSAHDESRTGGTHDESGANERRFVRVPADRLDGLLDLAGELVVCRSRMRARIDRMQELQDPEHDRYASVVRMVDEFATSTQFANLDGHHRGGASARPVRALAVSSEMSTLGLDRYDEIHVLSRQLDEAGNDIRDVRRNFAVEMQNLVEDAESLSVLISELQGEITQARMLPMETMFARLQLAIRDAAHRSNRNVEIVTRGQQVAVDKTISDTLYGPLLHMARNAVAHGIETAEVRARRGKPVAGTISLIARQEQGVVIIEVMDDGGGLDLAALKAEGVARGLVEPTTPESDPRVAELVFVQGLSTSREVGDVAGRGVGGNVIRRAVDRLNGSIQIETKRDVGTTFRITMPISMAITQALLLRAAEATLAVPIAFAEAIVRRDEIELVSTFGRVRARIGGHVMPVQRARAMFQQSESDLPSVYLVCRVGTERVAIEVDAVIGQEEIVVKSLGALLEGHPLFSGSTLRGNGELVLIMDVPGVLAAQRLEGGAAMDSAGDGASTGTGDSAAAGESASSRMPGAEAPATGSALAVASAAPAGAVDGRRLLVTEVRPLAGDKPRVLFVDDSLSVRKVGERMLLGLGVDVITAVDGVDALDKLRAMKFSLVFTDLEMPRMHGYELIRELQYLPAYREIPIVVISSRSAQRHITQALEAGAREYLTKPFSPETLEGVLTRLVRTTKAPSS